MHSDVRADVQAQPAATRQEQQRVIDRWRQEFNQVRPHQALSGKTPAEVYKVTERRRPVAKAYVYPKTFYVCRVSKGGLFAFRRDKCRLGVPFTGLHVGVQVVDALHVRAWLHDVDLGLVETLPGVDDGCFDIVGPTRKRAKKTASARPNENA